MTGDFTYFAPANLKEAINILASTENVRIIAGGTDLIPRMRRGAIRPSLLVDLRLLLLDEIRVERERICIGSYVTHSQISESDIMNRNYPALVAACREIGSPSIRNRATVGGNLVTASPAADTAPPLLVYEASVLLVGKDTKREVPLNDFFRGPGQTTMKQNELLVEVCLPLMPENTAAKYLKLGKRRALAISVVNAAVRLTLGEKRDINQACIALGSVAPTPYRAADAEKIMGGQMLSEDLIIKAAMEASRSAKPISDIRAGADYRRKMVEVLVRRSLLHAWSELSEAVGHG